MARSPQLVSALLLALILLVYPGGLAALPSTLRRLRSRLSLATLTAVGRRPVLATANAAPSEPERPSRFEPAARAGRWLAVASHTAPCTALPAAPCS